MNNNLNELKLLTANNFENALGILQGNSHKIRLYVGLNPSTPIIENITSKMIGQFDILKRGLMKVRFS